MTGEGAHCAPLFLGNYWTNQTDIFYSNWLDLPEELLLGLGPKYPEFPENFRIFRNVRSFGNFRKFMYK